MAPEDEVTANIIKKVCRAPLCAGMHAELCTDQLLLVRCVEHVRMVLFRLGAGEGAHRIWWRPALSGAGMHMGVGGRDDFGQAAHAAQGSVG